MITNEILLCFWQVYFELQHHAPNLKRIIDDQHQRLAEANQKISKVEKNQSLLEKRIDKAIQRHDSLEQRLQRLRSLPGTHKKPLTRAELDFKSELGKSNIPHKFCLSRDIPKPI